MTHRPFLAGRTTFAALALLGGFSPAFAQAPTLLDHARQLRELADSKADADARVALTEADKLARASAPVAVRNLKAAILSLDKSADVTSPKRTALVKLLEDKVAQLEGRAPLPGKLGGPAAGRQRPTGGSDCIRLTRRGRAGPWRVLAANAPRVWYVG